METEEAQELLIPGRLVLINWLDANQPMENGWLDPGDMLFPSAEGVITAGFILSTSDDATCVIQSACSDSINGVMVIPFQNIIKVQRLKVNKVGDGDQ